MDISRIKIEFTRKDYLKPSGKEGRYEYSYILPGFSPFDFLQIEEINLRYQYVKILLKIK